MSATPTPRQQQLEETLGKALGRKGSLPPPPVVAAAQVRGRLKGACTLPIGRITPDPNQPRKHFEEEDIKAFSLQLQERGLLNPVRVRWPGQGELYYLICGERRYRAALLAGFTELPCILVEGEISEADLLDEQLDENLGRLDLNPMDEAQGVRKWLDLHPNATQADCARRYGKSQSWVSKVLARLDQPPAVQELLSAGQLSSDTVQELAKLPDPADREKLAKEAAAHGLTAAEVRGKVKVKTICDQGDKGDMATPRIYQPSGLSRTSYTYPIGDVTIKVSSNRPLTPQEIETALETALLQHREKGREAA